MSIDLNKLLKFIILNKGVQWMNVQKNYYVYCSGYLGISALEGTDINYFENPDIWNSIKELKKRYRFIHVGPGRNMFGLIDDRLIKVSITDWIAALWAEWVIDIHG